MQSVVVCGRLFARAFVSKEQSKKALDLSSLTYLLARCHNYAQQRVPRPLSLVTASSGISKGYCQPNMKSKWSFGDDAYFVAKGGVADVIGVADGVGGWREYGIDPSQFPRTLMSICERLVIEGIIRPQDPKDIISKGYKELMEHKSELVGSCTACLVALDKEEKTLYSANLGDSGFLVIRKGQVVHRSEEQQHYFNTPFQLSVAPDKLEGVVLADSPDSAASQSFDVEVGDILVVGTDGLFDNMSDDLILHHTSLLKGSNQECVQKVANALAEEANVLAFDTEYMSPFAIHAAANGFNFKGGKPDDITVVLAKVTQDGLVTS